MNTESKESRWFIEEVQPHELSLRAYLRSVFPRFPDVDDLVQESYVRVLRAKEGGRIRHIKSFLFATARNAALDFFRRRKVVSIDSVADLAALRVIGDDPDPLEATSRGQEIELLSAAVRRLPDRCRQVMTLRFRYGMSQREISEELRISENTVKVQLAKGTRRCAAYLAARGLAAAEAGSRS